MRVIFLLVLIVGMGLAGYAAYMIMQQFEGYQAQVATLENDLRKSQENQVETTTVVVAADNLPFGTTLTEEGVKVVVWPADEAPVNAFTNLEDLLGDENSGTRFIRLDIETGEPISSTRVTGFGEGLGLRTRLRPGMRAYSIEVNLTSGVSGFLQPGDLVDIYWTGGGRSVEEKITKLILQGVTLMAIDQTSGGDISRNSVAKSVTLEVSPQVVAKLVQAVETGSLTLSLRGVEDQASIGAIEVTQQDINPLEITETVVEQECFRRERRGTEVIEIPTACTD